MDPNLRQLNDEVALALKGLTRQQTQTAPGGKPHKWSIQQIVEHLLATYRSTGQAIQARVEKGSGTRAVPTLQQRIAQFVVIWLGQFPGGREAPPAVAPMAGAAKSGEELAAEVTAELARMDAAIARGETLFAGRRAVSHIVLGPLSMGQWRRFHLIHGRHHLGQIKAIRRQLAG